MNAPRLVSVGLGLLGVFVMAGVALGGASAMAVPAAGPVGHSGYGAIGSCTISASIHSSALIAQINQPVVFTTYVSVHTTGHAVCPSVLGVSYSNLPAGPYSDPSQSCASANTPILTCTVGNYGAFDVTVSAHLSNGMTASASTWLFVNPPPQ